MKEKKLNRWCLLFVLLTALILLSGGRTWVLAAEKENKPIHLTADEVTYIQSRNMMIAKGKVVITQENGVLNCDYAEYNEKTMDSHLVGNVKMVKGDATLVADEVFGYLNKKMVAIGNAALHKGDKNLYGPRIEYESDQQYALVPNNARVISTDGIMTCDRLESWLNIDRAILNGNVHIYSERQNLDATAGHAEYYGEKSGAVESYAVLTIKPHVLRNGNVMDSDIVTVYMSDSAAEAEGKGSKMKFGEGGQ